MLLFQDIDITTEVRIQDLRRLGHVGKALENRVTKEVLKKKKGIYKSNKKEKCLESSKKTFIKTLEIQKCKARVTDNKVWREIVQKAKGFEGNGAHMMMMIYYFQGV